MNRTRTWIIPALLGAIAVLGIGLLTSDPTARTAVAGPPAPEALATAHDLSSAFEHVAEIIAPSVVTIRTTRRLELPSGPMPNDFMLRGPFRDFFGRDLPLPLTPRNQNTPRVQMGEGSGVVVRDDGHILTNSHVVEDADDVTVVFADGSRYTAEIVGTDPKTDIAVIKIDAGRLSAATLGDSNELRIGQWVVAAGNPFGLSSSITAGIISATGRNRVGIADYEDFIQTDAAINRGNSGGPLVDLHGRVIGINTAIASRTGGNVGIGFAIPSNMARDIMDRLIADGRVVRGYLGVMIQDVTPDLARSFGYDAADDGGALVSEVSPDGPAAHAGLVSGDIITHMDGEPVMSVRQLRLDVAAIRPGTRVELAVVRDGRERTVEVRIGELPSDVDAMPIMSGRADRDFGMTVETLTPELARRYGAERSRSGALVTSVEPFGWAGQAGLAPGDVITQVFGEPITSASDLREQLREADLAEGVRLTVERDGTRIFLFFRVSN